jgi:hypothetical protein
MRKMKNVGLLLLVAVITVFSSCQKEVSFQEGDPGPGNGGGGGGGNNTSIVGNYKFLGMVAEVKATSVASTFGMEIKVIVTSDYTSKNNVGTVEITPTKLIGTGIGYDVDTVMNMKTYMDGILFDDTDMPFVANIPPTSSTSDYTKISNDSITVDGGFVMPSNPTPGGGGITLGVIGSKLSWAGDTLIMKTSTTYTTTVTQQGVTAIVNGVAKSTTRLKKQ